MRHELARLLAGLTSVLAADVAHAQFDGIFLGGGIGLYKATLEVPGAFTFGNDKHVAGLNLAGGYGRSFGQFNVAGEVRYANEIGKIDVSAVGVSAKLQNAWSLSVQRMAVGPRRERRLLAQSRADDRVPVLRPEAGRLSGQRGAAAGRHRHRDRGAVHTLAFVRIRLAGSLAQR